LSSLLRARFAHWSAMMPEITARITGKKKAVESPTPSVSAPIPALAPIATEELNRLNLLTAHAVETPGMWPAAEKNAGDAGAKPSPASPHKIEAVNNPKIVLKPLIAEALRAANARAAAARNAPLEAMV